MSLAIAHVHSVTSRKSFQSGLVIHSRPLDLRYSAQDARRCTYQNSEISILTELTLAQVSHTPSWNTTQKPLFSHLRSSSMNLRSLALRLPEREAQSCSHHLKAPSSISKSPWTMLREKSFTRNLRRQIRKIPQVKMLFQAQLRLLRSLLRKLVREVKPGEDASRSLRTSQLLSLNRFHWQEISLIKMKTKRQLYWLRARRRSRRRTRARREESRLDRGWVVWD